MVHSRALSFRAFVNDRTCFNVGHLKWCSRKEKMKREKKKAKKKAKRMQKRVSLLSGLGAGAALPGTHSWRDPAEGRAVTDVRPAGALPRGAGMRWQGAPLPLFPSHSAPPPHSSQTEAVGGSGPCLPSALALPFGGGSKQESWGEPQAYALPSSSAQLRVLSGWCLSWDPRWSFYGSGLRVLSLSASPAPVGSPCPPT